MKKSLFLFFGVLMSYNILYCAHIIGSTMYYEITEVGSNNASINIFLDVYRDARGGGAQFDNGLQIGIFEFDENQNYKYLKTIISDPGEIRTVSNNLFSLNCDDGEDVVIEMTTYTAKVQLNKNKNYYFVYQRCCRSKLVTNLLKPEDNGIASPLILYKEALQVVHTGPKSNYNFQGFLNYKNPNDIDFSYTFDGEVTYKFAPVLIAGGLDGENNSGNPTACSGVKPNPKNCPPPYRNATFIDGYSYDLPFGLSSATSLNPSNGMLNVKPDSFGVFSFDIIIEASKNNIKLSELRLNWASLSITPGIASASGIRYFDIDGDGFYNSTFDKTANISIQSVEENCSMKLNEDGAYDLFPHDLGKYYIKSNDEKWKLDVDSVEIEFVDFQKLEKDLKFIPISNSADARTYIHSDRIICNDTLYLQILVENTGTKNLEGTLKFAKNKEFNFLSCDCTYNNTDDTIVIEIPQLELFNSKIVNVKLLAPDESFVGKDFSWFTQFKFKEINSASPFIFTYFNQTSHFFCSFDPNEIVVAPDRDGVGLFYDNEKLKYTIYFENLGNLAARNINVKAIINPKLEYNSIKYLKSSHQSSMILFKESRELNFKFSDINLQPRQTGFVSFEITPMAGLQINTEILQSASIYFDQNSPIITNTAVSIKADPTKNFENNKSRALKITPNPGSDIVSFSSLENEKILYTNSKLYDYLGRDCSSKVVFTDNKIDIKNLSKGVYFLKLLSITKSSYIGKLIVY